MSSHGSPLSMQKHRYGNAKVFYDKDGHVYYQGQPTIPGRGYASPVRSDPPPSIQDFRSVDIDRDRKRSHRYNDFQSLNRDRDVDHLRQHGYKVIKEEIYDPKTGRRIQTVGGDNPPRPRDVSSERDHYLPRDPSLDRHRPAPREISSEMHYPNSSVTPNHYGSRPLPSPPTPYQEREKDRWQRSYDKYPLVEERNGRYEDKLNFKTGYKPAAVVYILVAALMLAVGIVNVILCGDYHYYFRFWTGVLILLVGIFGFVHTGDYRHSWRTWLYVTAAIVTVLAAFVSFAFLVRTLSPQTTSIALSNNLTAYAINAKPNDPHVKLSSEAATWVCYVMDWFTFLCLIVALTLMSSAIMVFNKYWAANFTSTNSVEPFCRPQIFNPWGQAQLGQAMVIFGIIAVYTCTYDGSDTFWAKYWGPVWAGVLAVFAGWLSGIAGKREDVIELSVAAIVLQLVSMLSSAAAIVLCTLGLVDNINTAQDIDDNGVSGFEDVRDVTVASAVIYTVTDAVILVNVFYTFGAMVRHCSSVCRCFRGGQNRRRLSYAESQSSHSGFPARQYAPQYAARGPMRYGEYPSYERNNNGSAYRSDRLERY